MPRTSSKNALALSSPTTTTEYGQDLVDAQAPSIAEQQQEPRSRLSSEDLVQHSPRLKLSARSSISHITSSTCITSSSCQTSASVDWFYQLPSKVQRAQFTSVEQTPLSLPSESVSTRNVSTEMRSVLSHVPTRTSPYYSDSSPPTSSYSSPWYTPRLSLEASASRQNSYVYSSAETSTPQAVGRSSTSSWTVPRSFSLPVKRSGAPITKSKLKSIGPTSKPAPLQYLRDPETRLKLREYFGSGEAFDEILEQGFPSSTQLETEGEPPKPTQVQHSRRKLTAIADYQRALKEDSLDFLDVPIDEEDEDIDGDAVGHPDEDFITAGPRPAMMTIAEADNDTHYHSDAASSVDLDTPMIPRVSTSEASPRHASNPSVVSRDRLFTPSFLFGDSRESTIRITLTRPELRASDEEIYGWQHQQTSAQERPASVTKSPYHIPSHSTLNTVLSTFSEDTMKEVVVYDDESKKDDVGYCDEDQEPVDLYKPSMDLLALEPLPILPDHAAIAILKQAAQKDHHKSSAVKTMLARMRSARSYADLACM